MDFKYKIADVAKEFGVPAKKVIETVSGVTAVSYTHLTLPTNSRV